jgi:hypothetical protein
MACDCERHSSRLDSHAVIVICRQVCAGGLEWRACADLSTSIRLPWCPLAEQDVRHGFARASELAGADRLHVGGSCRIPAAQASVQRLHLLGAWSRRNWLDVGSICREGPCGLHRYVLHFSTHRDRDPTSECALEWQDWCIVGIRSSSGVPTTFLPPS